MSEEAQRTSGLFIPYPLLGMLMTLVLALGGGIIGMYVKLDTMNTSMILRDSSYQEQLRQQKEKVDQLEIYLHSDREKLAVLQHDADKRAGKRDN